MLESSVLDSAVVLESSTVNHDLLILRKKLEICACLELYITYVDQYSDANVV